MKFSAWQTSHKAPDITEAHHWRASKCLEDHSVSLCWLIVPTKSLSAADEGRPGVRFAWRWRWSGDDEIR